MSTIGAMRGAPAVVIASLALALAGCGGGGGGDRLSRAEFVSRADAICTEYEAKLNALGRPTNVQELKTFADKSIPIAREGRDELAGLNPPEELDETYDAWLEQGEEAIEIVERLSDAAEAGNTAEIQRIAQEAERADAESNRLAGELGFRQCGETVSPS